MIKRTCILLLSLSLIATATGCRRTPDAPADSDTLPSSQGTEAVTDPAGSQEELTLQDTESSTLPSTEEATEPDAPSTDFPPVEKVASFFEALQIDGVPLFSAEGDQDALLSAAENRITLPQDSDAIALSVGGWIGFDRPVDAFGYCLDGDEPVFGNFSLTTEDNVKVAGGQHALRFAIHIPLFDLNPGAHTLDLVAKLHDGTVVKLRDTVTLQVDGLIADTTVPYHATVTHVNGAACSNSTGSLEAGMASVSAANAQANSDGRIKVSGWVALENGVDRYVWSVDGIHWYDAESNGATGEPDGVSFAELGYTNAAPNALFTNLVLNLSLYDNETIDVMLGAVSRTDTAKVIPFATVKSVFVPDQLEDIVFSFVSDVTANPADTDLRASDLSDMFFINYGVGEPRQVMDYNDTFCYAFAGIHEMYANLDGRYALSAHVIDMPSTSFLFVRGYHAVVSDDILANGDPSKGQFHLNNYYETDCAGAMGGAGIYAGIHGDTLTIMIKYYDPNCISRVGNHITQIPCVGSTLTLTDDGKRISILVDGVLHAMIILSGETSYSDINNISPYGTFAASATISVVGGGSATIENTLVASSCRSQCGITIRGGSMYFDKLSILPLSES